MKPVTFLRNTWKKWEQKHSGSNRDLPTPVHPHSTGQTSWHTRMNGAPSDTRKTQAEVKPPEGAAALSMRRRKLTKRTDSNDNFSQRRRKRGDVPRERSASLLDIIVHPSPLTTSASTSSKVGFSSSHRDYTLVSESQNRSRKDPPRSFSRQPKPSLRLLPAIDMYSQEDKLEWGITEYQSSKLSLPTRHFTRHEKSVDACITKRGVKGRPAMSTIHEIKDTSAEQQCRSNSANAALEDDDSRASSASTRTYSPGAVENGGGNFPLSLFPEPPPLIVRKKVPKPLNFDPMSSQSSINSAIIGSPHSSPCVPLTSPSQTSFSSPSKKSFGRPVSSVPPPPTSPPNSPLPSPPANLQQEAKTSRTTKSAISASHRLLQ